MFFSVVLVENSWMGGQPEGVIGIAPFAIRFIIRKGADRGRGVNSR